jgi:hypothetical protein
MKALFVFVATVAFALLTSCGSSGAGSTSIVPPVQAQSGYTNASVSGTYAFSDHGLIGTFTADGNGNITSGTINSYYSGLPTPCTATVKGTYSVQSSGAGTATWTITPTTTGGNCSVFNGYPFASLTPAFAIEVAQQGSTVVTVLGTTSSTEDAFSAFKQ